MCNYHGYNSLDLKSSNFNTHFYNIDGNKSKFYTFISEIVPFDGKFSVIGIAETNISSDQKDLYNINEYNSFYSDKIPDKSKGTGFAIYVHDSFNSTFYSQASINLPHIESLFVQITKGKETINVGVMYRQTCIYTSDFPKDL